MENIASLTTRFGSKRLFIKALCCVVLLMVFCLNGTSEVRAFNTQASTVVVVQRLVLWAGPSLRTRVVAVLFRGRHFTVDGRTASGIWLHGVTDRGIRGWLPARGFLMLHPEVNPMMLPIMAASSGQNMMPQRSTMPQRRGY